jgi:hypothetical protein
VRAGGPTAFKDIFGTEGLSFEPDSFLKPDGVTPVHGDLAGTLAAYQGESPVRALFEVGASPDFPTQPMAQRQRFEMNFPSWPPPDATARTFFLGGDGSLGDAAPADLGIDRYSFDPTVLGTNTSA